MKINERIEANPVLLHASVGDAGNNDMAIRLARIVDERQDTLNGQTFNESVNQAIAGFGQELFNVETQAVDQKQWLGCWRNSEFHLEVFRLMKKWQTSWCFNVHFRPMPS